MLSAKWQPFCPNLNVLYWTIMVGPDCICLLIYIRMFLPTFPEFLIWELNYFAVAGIDKFLFPGDRPTPLAVAEFLKDSGISLVDKHRNILMYNLWDGSSNKQVTLYTGIVR